MEYGVCLQVVRRKWKAAPVTVDQNQTRFLVNKVGGVALYEHHYAGTPMGRTPLQKNNHHSMHEIGRIRRNFHSPKPYITVLV